MMEFFGASRLLAALTMAMAIGLCSAAANPILQTTPAGLLTGATGIDVNGTLYDVVFTAGSCVQVYGACEAANFPFHNLADASAASDALQRQVFLNTDQLLYDTIPALTRGCQAPLAAVQCNFATPYDIFFDGRHWVLGSTFENTDDHGAPGDRLFFMNNWAFWDQNLNDEGFVFVAWTKSTIPEPNVLAMFGAGLLALAGMRRKRKGA